MNDVYVASMGWQVWNRHPFRNHKFTTKIAGTDASGINVTETSHRHSESHYKGSSRHVYQTHIEVDLSPRPLKRKQRV
jgi:hypothetical protein